MLSHEAGLLRPVPKTCHQNRTEESSCVKKHQLQNNARKSYACL
jgi:hypothetical protein